jgi:hypothetical protein
MLTKRRNAVPVGGFGRLSTPGKEVRFRELVVKLRKASRNTGKSSPQLCYLEGRPTLPSPGGGCRIRG